MINKNLLNKKYLAYGSFFSLKLIDGTKIPCRNVLDIINRSYNNYDCSYYLEFEPDLIAIMMNPGSSKPLDSGFKDKYYSEVELNNIAFNELTLAEPDNTQYQIMRLMSKFNIKHTRILNISDVREPKSKLFRKRVSKIKYDNILYHSVFSDARAKEFERLVSRNSLYLLAWGVNSKLKALANQAYSKVRPMNTCGKVKVDNFYYHPLPQVKSKQIEWLRDIEKIIQDTGYFQ